MMDVELFGMNAKWHHLTNLLFHLANVLLLFWVLERTTGALWPSAFVAAAFAVHPLHVESVAWLAERKDVLSGFLWMLTLAAYSWYVQRPSFGRYALVFFALAFGLMAKPMLVTLPFVLLLLDYWPLGRLRWTGQNRQIPQAEPAGGNGKTNVLGARRLIVEKIPLFVLAAISSVVTFVVQQRGGSVVQMEKLSIGSRLANAAVSYVAYIGKIAYPKGLAVLYPFPSGGLPPWEVIVSLTVLLAVTVGAVWATRKSAASGYLLTGWLWYVGTLVPVIGLVQVGAQSMADRYTYLPSIGIFIIAAWGAGELAAKRYYGKIAIGIVAAALVVAMLVCTRLQLRYWRDNLTLFKRALAVTRNNYIMENNLALTLAKLNRLGEAIEHYNKALQIKSNLPAVHINLANALLKLDRTNEAVDHYITAIKLAKKKKFSAQGRSTLADAHYNLANALRIEGRLNEAAEHYKEALKLKPKDADTYQGLGLCLAGMKEFTKAVDCFKEALKLRPNFAQANYQMGLALVNLGRLDDAIQQFRLVLRTHPLDAEMHCNLGVLLSRKGLVDEAVAEFHRALELDPNLSRAREQLEAVRTR